MDAKTQWALGEFQRAEVTILFAERVPAAAAPPNADSDREGKHTTSRRTCYQGETLSALLVARLPEVADPRQLMHRWVQHGQQLSVEVELCTAGAEAASPAEEPSLERDYEGRETDHDKAVLMRVNSTVRSLDLSGQPGATGDHPSAAAVSTWGKMLAAASADRGTSGVVAYPLDIKVQVPKEHLGEPLALEIHLGTHTIRERDLYAAPSAGSQGSGPSEFTARLHRLFELSRVVPVRVPPKLLRCPVTVVQPLFVTSRHAAIGGSKACVHIEVENAHPSLPLTLHELDAHIGGTLRAGASSTRGGAPSRRRRRADMGGAAPLEGLCECIQQTTFEEDPLDLSGVFSTVWVGREGLPVRMEPGDRRAFSLMILPDAGNGPVLPRRVGGNYETPVAVTWSLGVQEGLPSEATQLPPSPAREAAPADGGTSPIPEHDEPPAGPPRCTSVHMAEWQWERRKRSELLIRTRGEPRVPLEGVFEISVVARNLSSEPKDLVLTFTPPTGPLSPAAPPSATRGGAKGPHHRHRSSQSGSGVAPAPPTQRAVPTHSFEEEEGSDDDNSLATDTLPKPPSCQALPSVWTAGGAAPGGPALGDVVPLDAAIPLGLLAKHKEASATVRLLPLRAGLVRLDGLCLHDKLTGAVFHPSHAPEVYVYRSGRD